MNKGPISRICGGSEALESRPEYPPDRPLKAVTPVQIRSGLAAGVGLVTHGGGLAATTGVLFLVTVALMLVGVAGHIARDRVLTMGVFDSGVTSMGATIATALLLTSQV